MSRPKDKLQDFIFSHHAGPGNWTLVVKLGDKCLYLLIQSHLVSSEPSF